MKGEIEYKHHSKEKGLGLKWFEVFRPNISSNLNSRNGFKYFGQISVPAFHSPMYKPKVSIQNRVNRILLFVRPIQ